VIFWLLLKTKIPIIKPKNISILAFSLAKLINIAAVFLKARINVSSIRADFDLYEKNNL